MKIACISDLHRQHESVELPEADILIIAGDYDILESYKESMIHAIAFRKWLLSFRDKYKHIIIIAGNHDFGLQDFPELSKFTFDGFTYLQDSGVTIEGINFWGSPTTPEFCGWAFMKNRGEPLRKHWEKIPDNTNVLITHGPPLGVRDMLTTEGRRCGDLQLLERVKQLQELKYNIFGHIHDGYGIEEIGKTTFINCSVLDEQYQLANEPIVFEY